MIAFEAPGVTLHHGDCIEVMRTLPDASVDAIVTDPPYGLDFMGKGWDDPKMLGVLATGHEQRGAFAYGGTHSRGYADHDGLAFERWVETWAREAFRVLKPGGHMLAFGGSRTWHRLAAGIEDAGFEIRDSIAWLYGSGFPKSLDVAKAVDKALGAEGEFGEPKSDAHAGWIKRGAMRGQGGSEGHEGWQSPWMDDPRAVDRNAREYLPGTEDARAFKGWGTALKPAFEPIVVARKPLVGTVAANVLAHGTGALNIDGCRIDAGDGPRVQGAQKATGATNFGGEREGGKVYDSGRWPTNVVLDDHTATELDRMGHDDSGGSSRFFPVFRYEAKAPTVERPKAGEVQHPTVKPLDLMRWLVRLVTPPDGTVLEPFAGSGTTLEAALLEGFQVIGIEREAEYLPLIEARLTKPLQPVMFGDWDGAA